MPMRVLIDECLPRKLKQELPEYDAQTVPEMGWAGKKNGELLQLMTGQFDVFITIDQNLTYQQNLEGASISVITLAAPSNRLSDLLPLVDGIKSALKTIEAGKLVRIRAE
jgi:hypothetical protein